MKSRRAAVVAAAAWSELMARPAGLEPATCGLEVLNRAVHLRILADLRLPMNSDRRRCPSQVRHTPKDVRVFALAPFVVILPANVQTAVDLVVTDEPKAHDDCRDECGVTAHLREAAAASGVPR